MLRVETVGVLGPGIRSSNEFRLPGRSASIVSQHSLLPRLARQRHSIDHQSHIECAGGVQIVLVSPSSPGCNSMTIPPQFRERQFGGGQLKMFRRQAWLSLLIAFIFLVRAHAQDDQLNKVHVQPPGSTATQGTEPAGAEAPPETGTEVPQNPPRFVHPHGCEHGAGSGNHHRPHEPAGYRPRKRGFSGLREQQRAEDRELCLRRCAGLHRHHLRPLRAP